MTVYQVSLGKLKGDSVLAKGEAEVKKSEAEEKTGEAEVIKGEAEVTKGKDEEMDGAVFGASVSTTATVVSSGAIVLSMSMATGAVRLRCSSRRKNSCSIVTSTYSNSRLGLAIGGAEPGILRLVLMRCRMMRRVVCVCNRPKATKSPSVDSMSSGPRSAHEKALMSHSPRLSTVSVDCIDSLGSGD